MFFRNPYNGHTLVPVLQQVKKILGNLPKTAKVDRGNRGIGKIEETQILVPKAPAKSQNLYMTNKLRKAHCKRAAIEPIIGHVKHSHGMNRNYLALFAKEISELLGRLSKLFLSAKTGLGIFKH